jgi:hypothetical protein
MADYRQIIRLIRFLALLGLIGVGGCSARGLEPAFQTAYSAIGTQLK